MAEEAQRDVCKITVSWQWTKPRHFIQHKKPILNTSVEEINIQELNCINMGCAVHFTDACNNTVNHVSSKMRNSVKKLWLLGSPQIPHNSLPTLNNLQWFCMDRYLFKTIMNATVNLFSDSWNWKVSQQMVFQLIASTSPAFCKWQN